MTTPTAGASQQSASTPFSLAIRAFHPLTWTVEVYEGSAMLMCSWNLPFLDVHIFTRYQILQHIFFLWISKYHLRNNDNYLMEIFWHESAHVTKRKCKANGTWMWMPRQVPKCKPISETCRRQHQQYFDGLDWFTQTLQRNNSAYGGASTAATSQTVGVCVRVYYVWIGLDGLQAELSMCCIAAFWCFLW